MKAEPWQIAVAKLVLAARKRREYGHEDTCLSYVFDEEECNCGWREIDEALREFDAAAGELVVLPPTDIIN